MARAVHHLPVGGQMGFQRGHHIARIVQAGFRCKGAAIGGLRGDPGREGGGAPLRGAILKHPGQRLDPEPRVGPQVGVGGDAALADGDRVRVDLKNLGIRPERAAIGVVPRQRTAHGYHEVRLGKAFPRNVGRKAPGDVEVEGITRENAPRGQGCRKERVALSGKRAAGLPCPGLDRAETGHNDNPLCAANHVSGCIQVGRIWRNGRWLGQELHRRCGQIIAPVPWQVLQVEGNAQNHRHPVAPGLQKGIADRGWHALRPVQRPVSRARRCHERGLIDPLVVPTLLQRRLACHHHEGQMCPDRRWKCGHQLGQARATGNSGQPHLP